MSHNSFNRGSMGAFIEMTLPRPKVLVARKIFPEGIARLQAVCDVDYNESDAIYPKAVLTEKLAGVQGALVTGSERIDAASLSCAKDLKIVSNMMVGYNNFDLVAMSAAGVMGTNTPDVLTDTTADLAFGLILSTARRMAESEHWLRAGHWQNWSLDQWLGQDVHGATLGIVGMGRIGQAIAKRAAGFAMQVQYYNRSCLPAATEAAFRATYADFETLLKTSDILVLVVPYSEATHHMIDDKALRLMKPTANLINIGRGGLVDDAALAAALREGVIAGAGLDVFEHEPRVHPDLLTVPNVTLTPHIGSATRATRYAMMHLAIDNLLAGLADQRPPNLLNP